MRSAIAQVLRDEPKWVSKLSPAWRYSLAVACWLIGLGVRLALNPLLGPHAPYLPFVLTILVAARLGGRGPGLFATALSAISILNFFLDFSQPGAVAGVLLFASVGAVISFFVGHLRESLISTVLAEEALRRQAQLIDLSHDAIITTDANQVITGWNAGAVEIYGWTEAEARGKVSHDLLRTRGKTPFAEIDRVLAREGRWDGELVHTTREGREIVVESRRILVRDEKRAPIGILIINRDITERKRAEEELLEAAEQRRLTLEAASLGAWDYRFETGATVCDERCRAIFGFAPEDPVDYAGVIARFHPDDRPGVEEAVKHAIAGDGDGVLHREFRVIWPDGSLHWVAAHGRVFFEGDGGLRRAVRFAGVNSDVTVRRQAEERLRQAQKLESVGMLAGGIAHDFNNLLTVIMGSASAALADCPSCEHSKNILRSSERAAYLTRQLLAYAGKGHQVVKLVDVSEVISESKRLLTASVPKKVALEFDLDPDLPLVETDPSRMEQILMNLVINASEAMPAKADGHIRIATSGCDVTPDLARLHSVDYDVAPGAYVCLTVRDNGSGMDAATISRIFEPFFTTKFTGRGLGLAAVQGIVRTVQGFIKVESTPGAGSAFRVYMPASGKKRSPERAKRTPLQQIRSRSTILVVDDEEMVRKLACMILRRYGYETLEAENGKDALHVLEETSTLPSLVLLDLAMPVMGGDELVPLLETSYPQLKILVSSGYPEEETRKVLPSGSIAGFIQKPYTAVALAEKIGQVLS
jgi:PAS domain S-box-containing protein